MLKSPKKKKENEKRNEKGKGKEENEIKERKGKEKKTKDRDTIGQYDWKAEESMYKEMKVLSLLPGQKKFLGPLLDEKLTRNLHIALSSSQNTTYRLPNAQ